MFKKQKFKFTNQELLTKLEQRAANLNQSDLVKNQEELLKVIYQWLLENPQALADDEEAQKIKKLLKNYAQKLKLRRK